MSKDPQIAEMINTLLEMEGVENNACTMRVLGDIYMQIVEDFPESEQALMVTVQLLETLHDAAIHHLRNMEKLPKEEQHYLYHGEICAQEEFVKILGEAYSDPSLTNEARTALIVTRVEAHAREALSQVAEPLAELREIMEVLSELKHATIH